MLRQLTMVREVVTRSLTHDGCRYGLLLMGLPVAEQIVTNDTRPGGLQAVAVLNVPRDKGMWYGW